MAELCDLARKAARTELPILIQGETGTGKELLARGIHYNSSRRASPLMVQNCGGMPDELLQSELFGHKRGAYTGAISATPVVLPEEGGRSQSVRIPAEDRRSPEKRMRIARGTTQITLCNGQIFDCKVVNLSLSGAALQLDVQPAIGERVRVGRPEGRVVRHTKDGIAVEFTRAAS
jgi:hypothetical protein